MDSTSGTRWKKVAIRGDRGQVRNILKPKLTTIMLAMVLSLLALPNYVIPYYIPGNFVLYPLTALYLYAFQPLVYVTAIDNPAYIGINYFELFFNWIIPALAVPFYYVVACIVVWIYQHGQRRGKFISSSLVVIFLSGLFVFPPYAIWLAAQAYAPAPPKDLKIVIQDQDSCKSIPNIVNENKGNSTMFTVDWDELSNACVFSGIFGIPDSYTSVTIPEQSIFVIRGDNSSIHAELYNMGTLIIDDNATFVTYGMSNDGKIDIKKTGTLDLRGTITSSSRSNSEMGQILPAVPDRIQIINEGLIHLREQQGDIHQFSNGIIYNFGAIINLGGIVLNDGEIGSYENATIINSKGGRIEIGGLASMSIYNMTNENAGSVVENYGNLYNSGTIRNFDGALISNIGFGLITNQGTIYNDAIIQNPDIGKIKNNWRIYNECNGVIEGEIEENVPIENCK